MAKSGVSKKGMEEGKLVDGMRFTRKHYCEQEQVTNGSSSCCCLNELEIKNVEMV